MQTTQKVLACSRYLLMVVGGWSAFIIPTNAFGAVRVQPIEPEPEQIALEVSLVGPVTLLPFQAVCLSLEMKNISGKRLGPIWRGAGVHAVQLVSAAAPTEERLRPAYLLHDPRMPPSLTPGSRLNDLQPLFMEPEASVSWTHVLAAGYREGDNHLALPRPLFAYPGDYEVSVFYDRAWTDDIMGKKPCRVRVQQPVGDDAVVARWLKGNPALAAAMISPVHLPEDEVVSTLEKIVRRFPQSTYAAYARFALARKCIGGIRISQRTEKIRGTWVDIIETPPVARADAIAQLEKINLDGFPYAPNVLVMMLRCMDATTAMGKVKFKLLNQLLREDYPDTIEYLDYFAESLTPAQWQEIAKNPNAPGVGWRLLETKKPQNEKQERRQTTK